MTDLSIRETAAHTRGLRRLLIGIATVPILLLATATGAGGWLYARQEMLLFHPVPLAPDYDFKLPNVQEARIPVDGAVLHALHFRRPGARGVVFFLHGNNDNNAVWLTDTTFYERTNYDLFLLDYRGYGKSTGRIESEAQLHADVRAAWDKIAPEYAGRKKVIYGRSVGTGLAAKLATEVHADLLVLVSPYSSIRQLAAEHYPWIPGALLRYRLASDEYLPRARMPVVIVHGENDQLIPISHAERLVAVRPDAKLLRLPGMHHNDVHESQLLVDELAASIAAL